MLVFKHLQIGMRFIVRVWQQWFRSLRERNQILFLDWRGYLFLSRTSATSGDAYGIYAVFE